MAVFGGSLLPNSPETGGVWFLSIDRWVRFDLDAQRLSIDRKGFWLFSLAHSIFLGFDHLHICWKLISDNFILLNLIFLFEGSAFFKFYFEFFLEVVVGFHLIEAFLFWLMMTFQSMFDILELVHKRFNFVFVLLVSDLVFLKTRVQFVWGVFRWRKIFLFVFPPLLPLLSRLWFSLQRL